MNKYFQQLFLFFFLGGRGIVQGFEQLRFQEVRFVVLYIIYKSAVICTVCSSYSSLLYFEIQGYHDNPKINAVLVMKGTLEGKFHYFPTFIKFPDILL